MENSSSDNNNTSILSRRPELTSADHGNNNNNNDETPEESSWTMYFEDFFTTSDARTAVDDDNCDDSSLISDAASFVGIKKINVVPKDPSMLPKKRRCTDVPLVGHHDLEDTASSPSRSPNNVFSMMNLLDKKRDKVVSDTRYEKGDISSGQDNEGGLSIDLKKKGLCLVPLSMFADYHD